MDLSIYNIKGQRVITLVSPDAQREAGYYKVLWNSRDHFGRPVSSGVYFYRIQAAHFGKVKKMILAK